MNATKALLILIGAWLILDGVVSIIEYWPQHWYEHAIRVVRVGCGIAVILIGWYKQWSSTREL